MLHICLLLVTHTTHTIALPLSLSHPICTPLRTMAPKKIANVPAFAAEDVADIVAHYKESNEKPVKNEVSEVPVTHPELGDCVRKYVFTGKVWVYENTSFEGKEIVDPELETEKKVDAVAVEAPKEDAVEAPKEEEPVVSDETATDTVAESESETLSSDSDTAEPPASDADAEAQPDAKPKKARKPRMPKKSEAGVASLEAVLVALDNLKIIEAKDMLRQMIGAGGVAVPKGKSKAADKGDKPKRKPTAYTLFMSEALKKVSESHPDVKNPKDRMRIAMGQWKAHKDGLVAGDE